MSSGAGVDVLVVGAGMAGLACARSLARAGRSVIVIEARERPGGRVLEHRLPDGQALELGGQWLGPGQDRALALAAELGLATYPSHVAGENVIETDRGALVRYRGTIPRLNPAVLADVARAQWRIERLARRVDAAAPWEARNAERLDGQTFETWIRRTLRTAQGRALMHLACVAVFSVEPRDLSVLHLAAYANGAGSLARLLDTDGGAQQWRIDGGTARLASGIAAELGERLLLEHPVERIAWSQTGVEIDTGAARWRAPYAVIAMAPALAGRIAYAPGLPADRDLLTQRTPMGAVIKTMAIYDTPFWRPQGLSGNATSLRGPVQVVFDNTPRSGSPGVLLAFLEGQHARDLAGASPEQRRAVVLDGLARLFGPQAAAASDWIEHDWTADEWSRGGYAGVPSPGTWMAAGPALRRPLGPLRWAGTETADRWPGYIDGAIRSGERAAAELLAAG